MINMQIDGEKLYQASRQNVILPALIGAIEKIDNVPTWILTFPDFPAFKGLVPLPEAGVDETLMYKLIGQKIEVVAKGVDVEANIVACSRDGAVKLLYNYITAQLEIDKIIPATVACIVYRDKKPYLVADIGRGVLVEIPRSRAALSYTKPLKDQYRAGQEVYCKVISTDPLELSVRGALPDPWIKADFRRGSIISGTVYNVQNQLVFLEPDLARGILGLCPVPLRGEVARGMRVSCKVRYFSREEKKLHLWLVNQL